MPKSTSQIKGSAAAKIATVELFYYEFCANSLGMWDREWSYSKSELAKAREARLEALGTADDSEDELSGEYGDVGKIASATVELTPAGVLTFAQNFAVDPNS